MLQNRSTGVTDTGMKAGERHEEGGKTPKERENWVGVITPPHTGVTLSKLQHLQSLVSSWVNGSRSHVCSARCGSSSACGKSQCGNTQWLPACLPVFLAQELG